MFTAGLASFPQVEKYTRCAIYALAGFERSPDQPQKPGIFFATIGYWILKPCVVATSCHTKQATHHPNVVLSLVGLYEFIFATNVAGFLLLGHFSPRSTLTHECKCPRKPGNSKRPNSVVSVFLSCATEKPNLLGSRPGAVIIAFRIRP